MNKMKTNFDAKLSFGFDDVTGFEGLVLNAGGGGKYPDHTILFREILGKLKAINAHNIIIFIAAKPTKANNYPNNEYRKIRFLDQTEFDFQTIDLDRFMSNANDEIREKGKVNSETANGSIHKRLLITSDLTENDWNELFENSTTTLVQFATIINNQEEEDLEYVYQKVKKRLRQSKFRKELLKAYKNTCAVTGSKVFELLEAAHIKPYSGKNSSIVTNGILLRSDIHDLFDLYKEGKRLIGISSVFKIEVHSSLKASEYWQYDGKEIKLPKNKKDYPII